MRILRNIVIGLILLIAIAFGVIWFWGGSFVKGGIESEAPAITGTDVTVGSVGLNLFGGQAGVSGLKIGNPQGFSSPHAIKLDSIDVELDLNTLLSDEVIIHNIKIKNPDLIVEMANGTTNLQAIQRSVMSGGSSAPKDPNATPQRYVIERVTVTGLKATLAGNFPGLGAQSQVIDLGDFTVEGIGRKDNGVLAQDAAQQILAPVMKKVQKQILRGGINKLLDKVGGDKVKGLGDKMKGLFD